MMQSVIFRVSWYKILHLSTNYRYVFSGLLGKTINNLLAVGEVAVSFPFVHMKIITILSTLVILGCHKEGSVSMSFPDLEKYSEYEEFFSEVSKITLYSTKSIPDHPDDDYKYRKLFHMHQVIGELEIRNQETISEILRSVKNNVYDEPSEIYTMCFNPRHGLRIESHNEVKDFQICFECHHLYIFDDINSEEYIRIGLKSPSDSSSLNAILDKHGIPKEIPNQSN